MIARQISFGVVVTLATLSVSYSSRALHAAQAPPAATAPLKITLPLVDQSVRFMFMGDNGTAERPEYEVAEEMEQFRQVVHFDFAIMLGDNLYGRKRPEDYKTKFEIPYKPLLDAGVKFYASLGNHDDPNERFYKPFDMNGHRYYSFKRGDVTFFALDSTYMDSKQLDWLDQELSKAKTTWKICFFHHPLYSDARHGPDLDLRARIEPLFMKYGVNVVFCGHEHVYERLNPQHGIAYFILGSSGQLRYHDLHKSAEMAKGFDTDRTFGLAEIAGTVMSFQVVSRTGATVDSGTVEAVKH
ncbi:MAG TPA: metallophosphoesterase [Bryobacteraceae bacterium]